MQTKRYCGVGLKRPLGLIFTRPMILLVLVLQGGIAVGEGGKQDQDGANYREGCVHLSWSAMFGHLKGKPMRVYRRAQGEREVLAGQTQDVSFDDPQVSPNRIYTYRIVPVSPDGKNAAVSLTMDASTVTTPFMTGEFKIHYGQGFCFDTGKIVQAKDPMTHQDLGSLQDADFALTGIWGNISQWLFTVPNGGTNGKEDPSRHGPPVGVGKFEDILEFPKVPLRPSVTMDTRSPDSLEVFVLRTKSGGIAKCKVIRPVPDRNTNWTTAPFWIRYVYAPAGDRFAPTCQEVESWPVALENPDRAKVEDWIRELGDDAVERREAATAHLISFGPRALPVVRERLANETDAERKTRLDGVRAALSEQCQPLQIALTSSEQGVRESAASKLRVLFGDVRPLQSEAEKLRAENEARATQERLERERGVRAARIKAAGELWPYPEGEARKSLENKVRRWAEATGDAKEKVAQEILSEGAKASPVLAEILNGKQGAAELIDACLDQARNLTVIHSRSLPEADEARTCYFSFDSGRHGYEGMVSIEFGNDTFQVQMYGGQKNELLDLGDVEFAGVKPPKSVDDLKGWSESARAVVGNVYLEHIWEAKGGVDVRYFVKFKVLAVEPGQYVLLKWEKLSD